MKPEKKILGDSWYASQFSKDVVNFDDHIAENYGHSFLKISKKIKIIRGILFFIAGRKFDIIVVELSHKGVDVLLALDALFSKKKNRVVLLGFIRPIPQNKLRKFFWLLYVKLIFGPSLKRSLAKAQVLTLGETTFYAKVFNVPTERFCFIPWPLHSTPKSEVTNQEADKKFEIDTRLEDKYVMVSGRLNVDWETIFDVAERSEWQLLAVCLLKQLDRVKKLNKNGRAVILHDLSQEDHGRYVKRATVYALCLKETGVSVGQIRLMNTNDNGVPVVATKVSGLEGYAIDGVNAILVPPDDVTAFKNAVDKLMTNEELRFALITSAKKHQQNSTFGDYLEKVVQLIQEVVTTHR